MRYTYAMAFFEQGNIAHYYGDFVRQLFIFSAILLAVAIPIGGDLLPFGLFFQIATVIVLVVLAGLTAPKSETVLLMDALVAGLGLLLVEGMAISNYQSQSFLVFLTREAVAVMLLFALYYSIKTIR